MSHPHPHPQGVGYISNDIVAFDQIEVTEMYDNGSIGA